MLREPTTETYIEGWVYFVYITPFSNGTTLTRTVYDVRHTTGGNLEKRAETTATMSFTYAFP